MTEDKFMPEVHLRQLPSLDKSEFTYSARGPFTKHKQRIQEFMQTGDRSYIYKNELDKACFANDAAYSDKVLKDKAFNIAKDSKYDGHQRSLASMVYKSFDKKSIGSGIKSILQNEQLAKELHKPIIRKLKKKKSVLFL